ncbi:DUF3325 domain-containing protein [Cupriavidus sp. AU9028]|uniref:DUF3325 domain-containing protein n=1 Tax=Cupriavidus sp. AU9028 TaxID=2871157 RepID=UPI001C9376EC|nr:DUF3325 domain-containing protein [Cupriavidus sp. AU9028]MBY4898938.1 DUF3325 domain-containing protein [Cupriavidus sp. AU9028]
MSLFALAVCLVAFGALALAMERHQQALFGAPLAPPRTRLLRAAGWLGLAVAAALLIGRHGWALGLVYFSGQTSVAAGIVHGLLILQERRQATR